MICTPAGRSIRLRLRFQEGSFKAPDVVRVIQALHREFPGPLTLLLDRLPAHRSRRMQAYLRKGIEAGWLAVEWLPAYAPELNPVEYVWGRLDGGVMANYAPPTLGEVLHRLHRGGRQIYRRPPLLRSFLKKSSLFF